MTADRESMPGPAPGPDRRTFLSRALAFLASLGGLGLVRAPELPAATGAATLDAATQQPPPAAAGPVRPEITEATIAAAEKLQAVEFTAVQRAEIAARMPHRLQALRAVREVPQPRDLQPALIFDPRLPGVRYPPQENAVILTETDPGPLPGSETDIAYAPITAQAHWIRTGQLGSLELTEIYLSRIDRIAGDLYCYTTVTPERARAEARAMDRERAAGRYRGPLHGIPFAIKDVFDTAGIPTTWGSNLYRDRVPKRDAAVVEMLRDAGSVLLGKAATAELGHGAEWFGGIGRNPWNTEETAGGSSTGSGAATAAGLCGFSIGTDSLGSVLIPADRCGVVGLRATFGRIPTRGAMPLTPSLDRIGPLTRTVEDAALVMAAINGTDATSATSIDMGFHYDAGRDVRGWKVGYDPAWFAAEGRDGAPPDAVDAHRDALAALRALGVELVPIEMPALPYDALIENLFVEAAAVFDDLTLSGRDAELLSQANWPNQWRRARLLSAVDYLHAERLRRQVMVAMHELLIEVDALVGPTIASGGLMRTMNFAGQPGVAVLAGFASSGTRVPSIAPPTTEGRQHTVPQSVAFHGRLFEEGTILALGRALEAQLDIWRRRPPVG